MTDHSPEFLSQYRKSYGPGGVLGASPPDYARCAEKVVPNDRAGMFHVHQCNRKNGHGPHGAWCRQHDPDAVAAKREAERRAYDERYALFRQKQALEGDRIVIIQQIAAGHNDPRTLCTDYLERWALVNGAPSKSEGTEPAQ